MKYSELTLQSWTQPLSVTEEQRVENTKGMIRNAIDNHPILSNLTIEVFPQGSYANNTNVRQNSDIDICVMLTSTFYGNYVDGKTAADYGYTAGTIDFDEYKACVVEAIKQKFGNSSVSIGNKSIKVEANSYHVNADVVPAFQYRDYKLINSYDPARFVDGIRFFAKNGTAVVNYPKDHINNGKQKNISTNHEYKKLVRIMKRIRNEMVASGLTNGDVISSFLVECLVWNVPNNEITRYNSWEATLRNAISFLWNALNDDKYSEWGEVSEHLYLFHPNRKWSALGTKSFLMDMYNFLQFE